MRLWDTILDLVFPARCLGCGRSGGDVCSLCFSEFPSAERKSAGWIFPLYDYRHPPVKKALWALKYERKKTLARIFALALYDKMAEELGDTATLQNFTSILLIPIPLSPKRKRERGFNQSELLCREISDIHKERQGEDENVSLTLETNVLIKQRDTEHQARIRDKGTRLRNITGSFTAINIDRVQGRNVILIDDILTTGATLSEAKKILRNSGAKKVIAFTIAH